ncbi:MAG: 7,8-dihydro-6-hydroxymethylpterin dimethyltransferase [Methanocorpusculum sp. MCE]|nr:MAG: 7,8-dihydro-6-hydroxymethylpterin dimethyltransferase [Methanocorpusculum sp. MCE]
MTIERDASDILTDSYNRTISNVRIAVTSACDLRCIYCHREGEGENGCTRDDRPSQMSKEEISELISVFAELGIKTIKITGGEPLLRPDLLDIIRSIPHHIESSLTTNGTHLAKLAKDLKAAGLSRVNVSLDTMNRETYKKITGKDRLKDVLDGIDAALAAGLTPVKLNMVILKGMNDHEIDDFLAYVRARGEHLILQIIELMDLNGWTDDMDPAVHGNPEMVAGLEEKFAKNSSQVTTRHMHHRRKYLVDGALVEVVRPMHNPEFCANCNRLRVTSDGLLKPCLLRTGNEVSIRGLHGDELKAAIGAAVKNRSPYFFAQ